MLGFRREVSSSACAPWCCLFAAGLIAIGRPGRRGALSSGSGPGLKNAQPGESWDLLRIMQAVTRSTSRISGPHRRNASPLQACCCSGEYELADAGADKIETRVSLPASKPSWTFFDPLSVMKSPRSADLREVSVNGGDCKARSGAPTTAEASRVEIRCQGSGGLLQLVNRRRSALSLISLASWSFSFAAHFLYSGEASSATLHDVRKVPIC